MRVLFFGSRGWTDRNPIFWAMDSVHRRWWTETGDVTIVNGAAAGADSISNDVAEEFGMSTQKFYAQWRAYGKGAGLIRNKQMLDSGLDRAYGFISMGQSPGSHYMLNLLSEAQVPTICHFETDTGRYQVVPFLDYKTEGASDVEIDVFTRLVNRRVEKISQEIA